MTLSSLVRSAHTMRARLHTSARRLDPVRSCAGVASVPATATVAGLYILITVAGGWLGAQLALAGFTNSVSQEDIHALRTNIEMGRDHDRSFMRHVVNNSERTVAEENGRVKNELKSELQDVRQDIREIKDSIRVIGKRFSEKKQQ